MAGLQLKTVNLPAQELVFSNKVYCSQQDAVQLCGQPAGYVEVKGCIFSLQAHPNLQPGVIAFNKVQREWARIGLDSEVFAKGFRPPGAFELGSATVEVDYYVKPTAETPKVEIKEEDIEAIFRQRYETQVLTTGQPIVLDFEGKMLKFAVHGLAPVDLGDGKAQSKVNAGMLASHSEIHFQQGTSGKVHVLSNKIQQRSIFRPDFNFEELGIGGLSKEFGDIFRRAFAARVFPPHIVRDLGIQQARGMLLFGPPGTGKTLIARKLAKFLKAAEPKIVNGPEILNKYVGQSEENIRKLFADAEKEQQEKGEQSQLHIIIFDEIDAICKSRGSSKDSTGVSDSIVNQLLSKIDGVDSLNNILLIGMTNRIDMMDEALLRPGRLEIHVEISLPDEKGRVEILNIHTKSMAEKGYLDQGVCIPDLAAETKNFSGAELEGLVRSATSFALNRKVNVQDISKPKDMADIRVLQEDFDEALKEIKPAFGCNTKEFAQCIGHGIIEYSPDFKHTLQTCLGLVDQVRNSENTPLLSLLLHGPPGCGKTALAAHLAQTSEYPFVRRIAAENYAGYTEFAKVNAMTKIFEDAYKSQVSVVVLDDIERLMDYVRIGPRFSNMILQALFAVLKRQPPKAGRRLLIIATTSDPLFLEEADLMRAFNVSIAVPLVKEPVCFEMVLSRLKGFATTAPDIAQELRGQRIGIRTLHLVAEMAVQRQNPVTKEVFMDCLRCTGSHD
eukprot:TRINITY_DN28266_c0_g1_i1.p1 TRINITY_DN28266_c0_g1~~TRINITY_DN28266_c0_g1_i1.p1  ORF type:complete len:728 (+),score=215.36 TRINITY_DN28266_c0_g1_i1:96-2279(+)